MKKDDDDDDSSDDNQSSSSTSDLDEESIKLINKVEKMIQRLNVKGVAIQIQDFIFTNQRNEQRKKGCYGCGELGHFVEVCPNKPTPKTKKKACKNQALTSIRSWDDSSSEEEHHHKRRDPSTHHQALLVCALWHEVTKVHPLVRVIVMMKCLLLINLCKKILNMLRLALYNKRS